MELELTGDCVPVIEGNVEIQLPSWMTSLCQKQLNKVKLDSSVLIAVGRSPDDDAIVGMDTRGRLVSLAACKLPETWVGPVYLNANGTNIIFVNGCRLQSKWFISEQGGTYLTNDENKT